MGLLETVSVPVSDVFFLYCVRQGENVPAPFMTFEATGFPAEILREVCMTLNMRNYMFRAST